MFAASVKSDCQHDDGHASAAHPDPTPQAGSSFARE